MFKSLRGKLTYANVVATLALFLVLAGGLAAAAISGSGTAKFGGQKGLIVSEWVTVLNLPGVGKLQGFCSKSSSFGFRNTSGKTLQATVVRNADGTAEDQILAPGERMQLGVGSGDDGLSTARFQTRRASS